LVNWHYPFSARLPRPSCHLIQVESAVYILSLASTYQPRTFWAPPSASSQGLVFSMTISQFGIHDSPWFQSSLNCIGAVYILVATAVNAATSFCHTDSDRELTHVNLPSLCRVDVIFSVLAHLAPQNGLATHPHVGVNSTRLVSSTPAFDWQLYDRVEQFTCLKAQMEPLFRELGTVTDAETPDTPEEAYTK
jgi:hypothetical protein